MEKRSESGIVSSLLGARGVAVAPRASVALTAVEWRAVAKCVARGVRLCAQANDKDTVVHAATAMKQIDSSLKAFSAQHDKARIKL